MASIMEVGKGVNEVVKNFLAIIDFVREPQGIDKITIQGYEKILNEVLEQPEMDAFVKLAFVSNYKSLIKEYQNRKDVIEQSLQFITDKAKPEEVEKDWFNFFFDKVRLVSDETVQIMWAKILASEVNTPGKYSKALLHTLSIMDSGQAKLFCNISRFCIPEYKNEESVHPILFIASNVKSYEKSGINFDGLVELEQLGLIQCDFKDEFIFKKKKILRYGNKVIEIYGNPQNQDKINVGNVRFTRNGQVLYRIVDDAYKGYNNHILEFMIERLKHRNCKIIINEKNVL